MEFELPEAEIIEFPSARRIYGGCQHAKVEYDEVARIITCRKCEERVDAFEVVKLWSAWFHRHQALFEEMTEFRRERHEEEQRRRDAREPKYTARQEFGVSFGSVAAAKLALAMKQNGLINAQAFNDRLPTGNKGFVLKDVEALRREVKWRKQPSIPRDHEQREDGER